MTADFEKAYKAQGKRRLDSFQPEYESVEHVFLAPNDATAPLVAKDVALKEGFNLNKVFRFSGDGWVEIQPPKELV